MPFRISGVGFPLDLAIVAVLVAAAAPAARAQTVDAKAAVAAILQADRECNHSVATRDRKKFLSLLSEIAVFVGTGPMRGHDEILTSVRRLPDRAAPGKETSADCREDGKVHQLMTKVPTARRSSRRIALICRWRGACYTIRSVGATPGPMAWYGAFDCAVLNCGGF